jgi:hypothetical protein
MTTASIYAERSRAELVTAANLEAAGACWISEEQAWRFLDGSTGAFTKAAPIMFARAGVHFSYYRFEALG